MVIYSKGKWCEEIFQGNRLLQNNPALFLQATKNGFEYYQDMKIAAIHEVHAMFNVDEKESVMFLWGGMEFLL